MNYEQCQLYIAPYFFFDVKLHYLMRWMVRWSIFGWKDNLEKPGGEILDKMAWRNWLEKPGERKF